MTVLPIFKGYIVDEQAREFRKPSPGTLVELVGFESEEGQRLLREMGEQGRGTAPIEEGSPRLRELLGQADFAADFAADAGRLETEEARLMSWVLGTLCNDEYSTDEELVAHFMEEGKVGEEQARAWVGYRGYYLTTNLRDEIARATAFRVAREARSWA